MTFRKVDWIFVAGALAVVAAVSMLPAPKDRNPLIPKNVEHQSLKVEKDCLQCHRAEGSRPVPARHPKRQDCFRCHGRSNG
ncbi:MAG: hypothetical protein GDA67_02245 [Nitrospira sp. CR1.3]|nr:hypothetical protein [Nitrospira sp. CR1.3]